MRVLYLGADQGTSGHRKHAMIRLGHQVDSVDLSAFLPKNRLIGQWRRHTGGFGLTEIVRRRTLQAIDLKKAGGYDVVWVDQGDFVGPRLLRDLKATIPRIVSYNVDDPFGPRDAKHWRSYLQALPVFDLVVVVRENNVEEAYRLGATRVLRVYRSADEVAHAPRQLSEADRKKWQSEVAFVGTAFAERGPFLKELIDLGVPLTIYGNRYHRLSQWPSLKAHWRPENTDTTEGYANAICAAKVCLGLLSKGNHDLHTTRSLEIPSLGGVFCADRTVEHLALYEENREAVFWSTPKECAEKCFALLADDSWRQSVAAAGRQRYLDNPWQNMLVMERILQEATAPLESTGISHSAGKLE
jgi:spore maturation protein CgeB